MQAADPAGTQQTTRPATHQGEAVKQHPSFHEELAAHLDAQAHPKPHPSGYAHGYPRSRIVDLSEARLNLARAQLLEAEAKARTFGLEPHRRQETPAAPTKHRTDWTGIVLVAVTVTIAVAGVVSAILSAGGAR